MRMTTLKGYLAEALMDLVLMIVTIGLIAVERVVVVVQRLSIV
jgi:hypothetical protein